jgi:hypothetical protein
VTTSTVLDQVCQFFGGPYDANTHTYRTPPAPLLAAGLSVVRRAWAKRDDFFDYTANLGSPVGVGVATGCQMVAQIGDTRDHRVALPAIQGRRKVHYAIDLHCFIWSKARYAEDCQDFTYTLRDALVAKIRTDPTLGTGGIENNAFQVGEGSEDGGGEIVTHMEQAASEAEDTKAYLLISFEAHAYDVA